MVLASDKKTRPMQHTCCAGLVLRSKALDTLLYLCAGGDRWQMPDEALRGSPDGASTATFATAGPANGHGPPAAGANPVTITGARVPLENAVSTAPTRQSLHLLLADELSRRASQVFAVNKTYPDHKRYDCSLSNMYWFMHSRTVSLQQCHQVTTPLDLIL